MTNPGILNAQIRKIGQRHPRVRRLKCDESKPACTRCEKSGFTCEYAPKTKPNQQPPPSTRALHPKVSTFFQPIFYQPAGAKFQSNQEHQYYRLFCSSIAQHLSGAPDSSLWTRLVPQACEADPPIRYGVIAIAALKRTSEAKHVSANWSKESTDEAQIYHQFAFKVYGKAIREMQNTIMTGKQDLRTALITSLVITCFESFHGAHESAVKQIRIGISLLEDHLTDKLLFQADSPSIENEIIQVFGRLEIQAMAFSQTRSPEGHFKMKDFGQNSIESMPQKFETFRDAEFYFEIVVQRLLHHMTSLVNVDCSGRLKQDNDLFIPKEHMLTRETHLITLRKWHDAFKPLLKTARTSSCSETFIGASSMQLVYLTTYFSAAVIRDSSQAYADTRKFMPLFTQMVSLARSILEHPSHEKTGNSSFSFEMQAVNPLYNVARRCPHRGLRHEAISLLLSYPRREGLWDSIFAGKFAEWVSMLEEEICDEEFVPDHLRCRGVDILECNMMT